MEYEDNPNANLEALRKLTPEELQTYVWGYRMACIHLREAFTKSRTEILGYLMELDPTSTKTKMLKTNIKLLDYYENLVVAKEASLTRMFPEKVG